MPSEGHPASPGNPFVPTASPVIPDHELLRLIGRGAYGEVWLASNAIGTLRAVKIVHRQSFGRAEHFEREFKGLLKFEPVSRTHEGLVHILQIGRRDEAGYFFYVMELADAAKPRGENGGLRMEDSDDNQPFPSHPPSSIFDPRHYTPHTLRSDLDKGSLPPAGCIAIGLKLASALEHLHANGLVHRDIKPSNIIFVNGALKLADIGLVTAINEAQSLVGTAGYIPPEGPGMPQADLYSLGKVLYEIAFGKDRQEFPQLPPDLQSHLDYAALLELNEIILKACETDSRLRYQSAKAVRDDLELLNVGKSVKQKRTRQQRLNLAKRTLAVAAVFGLLAAGATMLPRQLVTDSHVEKRSTNEVANHAYDLGKAHFDNFRGTNFALAADYFQQAIKADTNFAQAYGFLAATYFWSDGNWNPGWQFLPRAKVVALRALALDQSLAEPHLALGWYHTLQEWAWSDAEKEYQRAIKLNPTSAFCHLSYAEFLRVAGRMPEALKEINEAKALDPHSRIINIRLPAYLADARQFTNALAQIDLVLANGPNTDVGYTRQNVLCALGRFNEAIEAERQYRITAGESSENLEKELGGLKLAITTDGSKAYWQRWLTNGIKWNDSYEQACAYVQMGRTNEALNSLNQCLKERDTELTMNVMSDWMLDPVRSDPRFQTILKTMRLEWH